MLAALCFGRKADEMTRDEIMKLEEGREMDWAIQKHVIRKPLGKWETYPFSYSVEIDDTWRLVEMLKENYLDFDLYYQAARGGWLCAFGPHLDKSPISRTAPLAICRAALLAVQDA
jgi:hypothetical protein